MSPQPASDTVAVTGATGMVGSYLCVSLLKSGKRVRALYRHDANREATRFVFEMEGQQDLFSLLEWVQADLLDVVSLDEAFENVQVVYHCAALVSFRPEDYERLMKTNAEGTANVVDACLRQSVERLCHVSSVSAIGADRRIQQVDETFVWKDAGNVSAYGLSKHRAELEVWRGAEEGLKVMMVNPSIILGAGNWEEGSARLVRNAAEGMTFISPGENGFVDVRDVVEVMLKLMEQECPPQRYIINGHNLSYKELFDALCSRLGVKAPKHVAPRWMAELMWRAEKLTQWISGRKPLLTRETVKSAYKKIKYDNKKVVELSGHSFLSLDETASYLAMCYRSKG
jgi:dihydroflavonol-4-reductase